MKKLFERIFRFRTWILNLVLTLAIVAPDLLNSPELLALIPAEYQRWVIAGAFLINIWMRPRPAVLPSDPEVMRQEERR
ncbi:hypothetical protein [Sinorhizobium sp. BJ1]|uniref:hypothetical protein n=1 Tax=Sinorhizobium sp. BJ1 TaxID=2035455 RepID=UPI000BEABF65|nr:hypothetical protein [Sinorhizobium sp. BJ1]PDT80568.1 hypothetical protein CO676_26570 [Sinorhizobium sp. BJ1]